MGEAMEEQDTPASLQSQRKHVFVVNGAAEFLELVRELLQDEQFNVTTTNYVPQTWDQIAALAPDLVLVDIRIGQRAGWDLLERLAAELATRGIPTIVFSTDPELLDRARESAALSATQRYLAKPFDIDELMKNVHDLIGGADRAVGQ